MDQIEYEDFKKLDMRIGKVLEVERVPDSKNLYKLKVDVRDKTIQIVTSLVEHYKEEELLNRKIIVLVNLKPAKIRGEISKGMLLCAEDEMECVLLGPERDMPEGTQVT